MTTPKTMTLDLNYSYTNKKGLTITVAKALEWLNAPDEDGESRDLSPAEIVCRYYFRERALADDQARKAAGKLANRLYSPDISEVEEKVPAKLEQAIDLIVAVDASRGHETKAAPKAAPKAKAPVVKKAEVKAKIDANAARIAELEAKLKAKGALPPSAAKAQ